MPQLSRLKCYGISVRFLPCGVHTMKIKKSTIIKIAALVTIVLLFVFVKPLNNWLKNAVASFKSVYPIVWRVGSRCILFIDDTAIRRCSNSCVFCNICKRTCLGLEVGCIAFVDISNGRCNPLFLHCTNIRTERYGKVRYCFGIKNHRRVFCQVWKKRNPCCKAFAIRSV